MQEADLIYQAIDRRMDSRRKRRREESEREEEQKKNKRPVAASSACVSVHLRLSVCFVGRRRRFKPSLRR